MAAVELLARNDDDGMRTGLGEVGKVDLTGFHQGALLARSPGNSAQSGHLRAGSGALWTAGIREACPQYETAKGQHTPRGSSAASSTKRAGKLGRARSGREGIQGWVVSE